MVSTDIVSDVRVVGPKTVGLVACTSRKGLYPTTAEFLYQSPLFWGARSYALNRCDRWFILSAKYGLVNPDQVLNPYDESLYSMSESQLENWATQVYESLSRQVGRSAKIVFLAGDKYRSGLQKYAEAEGRLTCAPLSDLGIGRQVAWLQKLMKQDARLKDIDRFYALIKRVAALCGSQPKALKELNSSAVRATKGIYFFFATDEFRMTSPFQRRVVRVGTHAVSAGSKSTLWGRLRTHRGGQDGLGNHRGSIFRLHVGESLIRRAGLEGAFPSWGVGQSATKQTRDQEVEIELEVSDVIGGMAVLWLEVPDEPSPDSDRGYLERNIIALLSGPAGPLDLPRSSWLGHWSGRDAVRYSGLWNVNHVMEDYDPIALDVMESYVEIAEGKMPYTCKSLAPMAWRMRLKESSMKNEQLHLI